MFAEKFVTNICTQTFSSGHRFSSSLSSSRGTWTCSPTSSRCTTPRSRSSSSSPPRPTSTWSLSNTQGQSHQIWTHSGTWYCHWSHESKQKYFRIEFLILGAALLALFVNHDFSFQEVSLHPHHHHHTPWRDYENTHWHHHHHFCCQGDLDFSRCCGPFQFT